MRRGLLVVSIVGLAQLGPTAGAANAAVFCVNKPTCLGTPKATIQAALDAAETNGATDSIFVDANGGTPYNETLSYSDPETVHIIGDGRSRSNGEKASRSSSKGQGKASGSSSRRRPR